MAFMDWICCPHCDSSDTTLRLYSDATAEAECADCGLDEEYEVSPLFPGYD